MPDHAPIAVTGMGCVSPLGVGVAALTEGWSAGRSGIVDGLGRCRDFDAKEFLARKEIKRFDPFTQFAVVAAAEAMAQADWGEDSGIAPERVGVVVGSGSGGTRTLEEGAEVVDVDPLEVSGLTVPKMMANAAAGVIALRHGFRGPAFAVVSACSSGSDAIADGVRMIRLGEADAVLVGGAEAQIQKLPMAAFGIMEALSPTGMSRPFDRRRDGFVMAEGAGILVLERADVARARGADVLGWVLGYGVSNDAYHLVAPHPEGRGAIQAMRLALANAGLEPGDVDYVNAHGTGTPANDATETHAIKQVLGARAPEVPVSSLKSAIGHLIGAAGALEAIATIGALRAQVAPPTLNLEDPDDGLDLDYVALRSRPMFDAPRERAVALSNSFGFGGHNSVLALAADRQEVAA